MYHSGIPDIGFELWVDLGKQQNVTAKEKSGEPHYFFKVGTSINSGFQVKM